MEMPTLLKGGNVVVLCSCQAINAEPYGVVGVLVYTDPLDINDGLMSDANETYPHSWYLPPSGVERGSFNTHFGDMLTPYLAAKGEQTSNVQEVLLPVVFSLFYFLLPIYFYYCRTLAPVLSEGQLQSKHTQKDHKDKV